MAIMNHRERRAQAKRDAKTKTCQKHPSARFIVQGTRLICPVCYSELLKAKHNLKLDESTPKEVIIDEHAKPVIEAK